MTKCINIKQGPEPVVVEVGVVEGALTLFVGHERPGGIFIYIIPLNGLPIRHEVFTSTVTKDRPGSRPGSNRVCIDLGIEDIM